MDMLIVCSLMFGLTVFIVAIFYIANVYKEHMDKAYQSIKEIKEKDGK